MASLARSAQGLLCVGPNLFCLQFLTCPNSLLCQEAKQTCFLHQCDTLWETFLPAGDNIQTDPTSKNNCEVVLNHTAVAQHFFVVGGQLFESQGSSYVSYINPTPPLVTYSTLIWLHAVPCTHTPAQSYFPSLRYAHKPMFEHLCSLKVQHSTMKHLCSHTFAHIHHNNQISSIKTPVGLCAPIEVRSRTLPQGCACAVFLVLHWNTHLQRETFTATPYTMQWLYLSQQRICTNICTVALLYVDEPVFYYTAVLVYLLCCTPKQAIHTHSLHNSLPLSTFISIINAYPWSKSIGHCLMPAMLHLSTLVQAHRPTFEVTVKRQVHTYRDRSMQWYHAYGA